MSGHASGLWRRALRPLASWLLPAALVGTAACDEDGGGRDEIPTDELELPLLSCIAPLENNGECARNSDCTSGLCVLDTEQTAALDRMPLMLSCGRQQGPGAAFARCVEGADCESGLCGLAGACFVPCAEHADCAPGQFCLRAEVRVPDEGLAPAMVCVRNVHLPEDVTWTLGPSLARVSDEQGASIKLETPAYPALWYLRTDCDSLVQVQALRALSPARDLFDIGDLILGKPSLNPVINSGSLVPLLLPNNPALLRMSTEVRAGLAVLTPTPLAAVVASRRSRGRTLDLNVFYVGAGSDEVANGFHPGNARVGQMMSALREAYADVGITLGDVREYDVVGALRDELSVLDAQIEFDDEGNPSDLGLPGLDRLFELSSGVIDGGLNLFLLREMGDVLGIAGGIPGALGVHGTAGSGVAVAFDMLRPEEALQVTMHELSHQMGLFHTTEIEGLSIEPIEDTPVCGPELDHNGDSIVSAGECRNHGGGNLMFWGGLGLALSAQQVEILKSSLILR